MKVLVTATIQFRMTVRDGTSRNEATHAAMETLDDPVGPTHEDVNFSEIKVENLDSEDGSFA